MKRYWLQIHGLEWQEVTKVKFIEMERTAGYYSKSGRSVVTDGFSTNSIKGRVTHGEITQKNYGWDPEFLRAAKKSKQREVN